MVPRQEGGVMAETRPGERSEVIRRLIRLFEAMNVDEALTLFTEDARYRFGNYPTAVGREDIRKAATSSHLEAIKGVSFKIQGLWEVGDVLVCEMEIEYIRTDDSVLTLPCTDVFRMEGNRIKDMRIYMDPSPLFA
jgi:limonene-1,2-epoxide hydrolase